MLQSFTGTVDAAGLRTLRPEDKNSKTTSAGGSGSAVSFWAILDSGELSSIERALQLGRREDALELLVLRAKSLGRLYF